MNIRETQRRQDNYQNSQGLDSLYMLQKNTYSYNTTPSTTNMAQLRSLPQSQKLVDLVKSGTQSSLSGNNTGIPTQMKEDFEAKSGFSFNDVKVHYNSDKPAQLQALAYTQGNQVYVGPGQEKHLLHELGHVVQQKQGIVKPTTQVNGVPVNDDPEMEASADCYGVLGNLASVQMMKLREESMKETPAQMMTADKVVQRCGDQWVSLGEGFVQQTPSGKCPQFMINNMTYHVTFGEHFGSHKNWNDNCHITCDGDGYAGIHYYFYIENGDIKSPKLPPSANKKGAENKQRVFGDLNPLVRKFFQSNFRRIIG